MKVIVEECYGVPKENTEEFATYLELIKEMSLIIQPKTPMILYEKFFISLLEREEISINALIKVLVGIIILEKYAELGIEQEKEILLN
jgi:hypothetical protein